MKKMKKKQFRPLKPPRKGCRFGGIDGIMWTWDGKNWIQRIMKEKNNG